MINRTLDKRLKRLEETTEPPEEIVYIYDPKVGVPEYVDTSFVVFLPDNGRDPVNHVEQRYA